MADISMCVNSECKGRDRCYRYRAYPNKYTQSYLIPQIENGVCNDVWWHENRKDMRTTKEADESVS